MAYKDQVMDLLHSRLDKREELIDKSLTTADRVIQEEHANAVEVAEASGTRGLETLVKAMEILAARVGEDMAEVTTAAVQSGGRFGKRLAGLNRGSVAEEIADNAPD